MVGRDGVERAYPGKATLTLESGEVVVVVVVVETPGGGVGGRQRARDLPSLSSVNLIVVKSAFDPDQTFSPASLTVRLGGV